RALAANELRGRPLDHYEKYRENFRSVTAEQVLAAAKKYLHPDMLKIVVVGKPGDVRAADPARGAKLEDFGRVRVVPLPDVMK
ncbi:MAG: hypothetical protein ACYTAF_15220, partial [Planctomycetota bacterium]